MSKGFRYRIIVDPKYFDEKEHYQSKIISLAVSWIDKVNYKDADLITFLALTNLSETPTGPHGRQPSGNRGAAFSAFLVVLVNPALPICAQRGAAADRGDCFA